MATQPPNLIKGSLDLLVLRVLSHGNAHGYGIMARIRDRSEGAILVEEGSLYPALHRMERQGWIEAEWGLSEQNRRAKFYSITRRGRGELAARERDWRRMTEAIDRVLRPAAVGA